MPPRPTRALGLLAVAVTVALGAACSDDDGGSSSPATTVAEVDPAPPIVFNGQGNHLDAYSSEPPFEHQRVISAAADDPEAGLDINAQLCFFDDGGTQYLIAGEDTDQGGAGEPGWGIFEVTGDAIGELEATQVGKLTTTYTGESNPENYGCGILSDGRIVTGDVGNQASGPGTGQLIIWFPPFDTFDGVASCKLDVGIGTAGQILVDDDDSILIASSLGRTSERPSGVHRYSPPFPNGPTAEDGCGRTDDTGAPLADEVARELFIDTAEGLGFPAGIVASPAGGYYVSSQATGVINEYDAGGRYVRTILRPPDGDLLDADGYELGSPHGLGIGPDGTLYYADIGLVRADDQDLLSIGPGEGTGAVRRITFDDEGEPNPPEVMAEGLDFPDGIGILVPR
jgi:hypothetical protein